MLPCRNPVKPFDRSLPPVTLSEPFLASSIEMFGFKYLWKVKTRIAIWKLRETEGTKVGPGY